MRQDNSKRIFVIWDPSQSDFRIQLQTLERRPPPGFQLILPDSERTGGEYLQEVLLPGLEAADRVLVVGPPGLSASLAFELGVAVGLGKNIGLGPNLTFAIVDIFGLPAGSREIEFGNPESARALLGADASWGEIALPRDNSLLDNDVVLCPSFAEGAAIREEIKENPHYSGWSFPSLQPQGAHPFLAAGRRLLWVIPPGGERIHRRQQENAQCALVAGVFCGSWWKNSPSDTPQLRVLRSRDAAPVRAAQRFESTFSDLSDLARLLREDAPVEPRTLTVERLEIRNFKSIKSLVIDLAQPSSLSGTWTCIAGINGAGKSSILQVICMLLLGEKLVAELGRERLKRMLRREGAERFETELTLVLRDGEQRRTLYLPINENGVDGSKLYSHPDYSYMPECWERLQKQVLVSYGASRNLSEYKDSRYSSLSRHVQRQMSLFDPLAQIASVDVLLEGGNGTTTAVLKTLRNLLGRVLQGELAPSAENGSRMSFDERGTAVEALDLPDGFRSTVAWLADLCSAWHQTAPAEETESCDPAKIRGIVLLDEIDLHLHPRLQRGLVPRLREALPLVQFIVTTHSPLVLSSFDRAELVVLDRDAEEGVRELDRQIFAFSTDQVYQWLMDTPPQSTVIEEKLERGDDAEAALLMYQSEDRNEAEAKLEIAERKQLIAQLRRSSAQG